MLLAPVIAPDPDSTVEIEDQLLPPSLDHPFGTDQLGRDVFSRVIMGSRISLPTGLIVVSLAGFFGLLMAAPPPMPGARSRRR